MRRASRTDANHAAIRDGLRDAGCIVEDTSGAGNGFPDLVALYRNRVRFLEVKDGAKPPSARALTPAQVRFHRDWHIHAVVVTSLDEALKAMGVT